MADSRAPYELVLRFGVDADSYDEARGVARVIAEHYDGKSVATQQHAVLGSVSLLDLRVERRGAMRP